MVDFAGNHVVVTGGTGALGRAVIAALRAGNAVCHVPNLIAAELEGFPYASDPEVHIARDVDLADEAAVKQFYERLPPLWASIHLAGGFAMSPIGETSAQDFIAQFRMNTLSCFLCSAAAIAAFRARKAPVPNGAEGGRIVNVSARPALEPRLGAGMVAYTASKSAVDLYGNRQRSLISVFDSRGASVFVKGDADRFQMTEFLGAATANEPRQRRHRKPERRRRGTECERRAMAAGLRAQSGYALRGRSDQHNGSIGQRLGCFATRLQRQRIGRALRAGSCF